MKRREFIRNTGSALAVSPFLHFGCRSGSGKKMLVLGIDGLDPSVVLRLMKAGQLPNLARLAERGTFTMMRSTVPPQSPVAWGSFISGADPGAFGIFDFIHRNPANYFPEFSMSETVPSRWTVKLGKYRVPLKPGKVVLKRGGPAFWDLLEKQGVDATICKVPTNFPPSSSGQRTLSGLGTPDLMGGYGVYTLYTSDEQESQSDLSPHRVYYAYIDGNGVMEGQIEGPPNDLVEGGENVTVDFRVYVDETHRTVRIDLAGREILLAEKEYSDWVEIDFTLIPNVQSLRGMVKFYLLEMGRRFRLYVSPVQMSPRDPALPISTPSGYSRELADRVGLFHTLGLPADTNAIKLGTFSIENYIVQLLSIFDESRRMFECELERFASRGEGFLFFYFSTLDQGQHIFWALNDRDHPFFHPRESREFGYVTDDLYRRMDRLVGRALKRIGPSVPVMVISDHGFAPFRREVNVNTWLLEQGYIRLKSGASADGSMLIDVADWAGTRAYGLGLNGLYLNLRGREAEGIVPPGERRRLVDELKGRLEALVDPVNGEKMISTVYVSEDCFSPKYLSRAPDMVLGFNRGYRSGDRFGEGGITQNVVSDNRNWWSGDHCIDPRKVPATFISSFKAGERIPELRDMAPTILRYFGIEKSSEMNGTSLI